MKNVSNKKSCNLGIMQVHMKPPPIPLIKSKHGDNSEKDYVKLKLRRYPTSATSASMSLRWLCLTMAIQKIFIVCEKNQHDSGSVRDADNGRKDPIPLYSSPWRVDTSVLLVVF